MDDMSLQQTLFGMTFATAPMSRRTDPSTSSRAAAAVRPVLGKIQLLVLAAYAQHGPMSARQAERLPDFEDYGFSTIRKRISELSVAGFLAGTGVDTDGKAPATSYELTGKGSSAL